MKAESAVNGRGGVVLVISMCQFPVKYTYLGAPVPPPPLPGCPETVQPASPPMAPDITSPTRALRKVVLLRVIFIESPKSTKNMDSQSPSSVRLSPQFNCKSLVPYPLRLTLTHL